MSLNALRECLADAWAGLCAAPARAVLSFAALAAGLAAATLLLAVSAGLERQARTLTATFGADAFALLPAEPDGAVAPPPWTRGAVETLRLWFGDRAWVSGARAVRADGRLFLAADEHWAAAHGWRILRGRPLDAADVRAAAPVLLTHGAASVPENPGAPVVVGGVGLRWIGATDAPADTPPCIPWSAESLDDAPEPPGRTVDRIWFRARPGHSPEALRRILEPRLAVAGIAGGRWVTPESLLGGIRRWQRTIAWSAGGGALLGLLLGATSLAGLLLSGVRERIPEIGLRRAIGASAADVAALFVAEAFILTTGATAVGIAAAGLLLRLAGDALPLPWSFTPGLAALPVLLSLLLAAAASALPAAAAARLPPAEALRNE
ncbi:MAG: ABC transporter permease [Kiritimatiellae bacterium]|nr:ABC transporter permease [Kiritimatiellia bacterium]